MLEIDLIILFIASILTFALFAYDKHLATYGKFRVPEAVLLLFAFLGGAFGAFCAMQLFRHKTHKPLFYITVAILMILQIGADILIRLLVTP